jgi:hypothetical protein
LKYQTENPHAALLTSFLLCAKDVRDCSKEFGPTEDFLTKGTTELRTRLFPPINLEDTLAEAKRRIAATYHFMNDKEMLRRYQKMYGFSEAASVSGMQQRDKNKILDKIPRQLKLSENPKEARKQVELRMSYKTVARYLWSGRQGKRIFQRNPEGPKSIEEKVYWAN